MAKVTYQECPSNDPVYEDTYKLILRSRKAKNKGVSLEVIRDEYKNSGLPSSRRSCVSEWIEPYFYGSKKKLLENFKEYLSVKVRTIRLSKHCKY
jgi:hypothetical protein